MFTKSLPTKFLIWIITELIMGKLHGLYEEKTYKLTSVLSEFLRGLKGEISLSVKHEKCLFRC